MTDQDKVPLDGLRARLADGAFATQVAGWWLSALGAAVEAAPATGEIDADLRDVIRRFLARRVKRTIGTDVEVVVGSGTGKKAPQARPRFFHHRADWRTGWPPSRRCGPSPDWPI